MRSFGDIRKMRIGVALAALMASSVAWPDAARTQGPGAAPSGDSGPVVVCTNKTEFRLPIKIDDRARGGLREISLYVRQVPGEWQRKDTVPPSRDYFTYRVTHDGEYWFNVVTLDKQNRSIPADVTRERAGLIVFVDTQPPAVALQPLPSSGGEAFVRCTIHDEHPDYAALKLSYRGTDQPLRLLEAVPGNPGVYRLPSTDLQSGWISVLAKDRAGNSTTKEFSMRDLVQTAHLPPPNSHSGQQVPYRDPLPPDHALGGSPPHLSPQHRAQLPPPRDPLQPVLPVEPKRDAVKPSPEESGRNKPPTVPPTIGNGKPTVPTPPGGPEVGGSRTPSPPGATTTPAQRKILNTTHVSLEYRLDQVGPSGIAKVEVWITANQGETWQRLCEDADRRSPVDFDLPGEGLFGVRLVVTNGNGFGGTAPAKGETPHSWVEVDASSPVVQVRDIEPVTNGSTIDIRWTASDRNLGPEPVNLYFANRKEGPWNPIVRGVKNDGMYRWAFPRDAGAQFFFRVEISDQAGNVARAETPTAVMLDMTEPRALVIGISGVNSGPPR